MTRVFVYEHITAHGFGRDPASPEHSLAVEGRAMFDAIRADFSAIPNVEVLTGEPRDFALLAAAADWSFIIAPETDGVLLRLAEEILQFGGRLLGPTPEAIALTSDKFAMVRHWKRFGVPTPETVLCPARPGSFPCVVKRRDGAGSEGMRIVRHADALDGIGEGWIAQPFVPGMAASVAAIASTSGFLTLPPAFQCLSGDGAFRYAGGGLPIAPALATRAERLARKALADIPGLLGYIGVDLILGADPDGGDDVAIEINPRLTTSYVGLRAHLDGNLAALILELAEGKPREVRLMPKGRVAFTASGKCSLDPSRRYWNSPGQIAVGERY